MSYQALTQPASIGRVLDSGFKLFAASLKPVLVLLLFAAIVQIIMQYSMVQTMAPLAQITDQEQMAQQMSGMWTQIIGFSIVVWIVSMIIYNAILVRVNNAATGASGDIADALIVGLKKTFPVFVAAILYMLAISIGFVLLAIPGFILMVTLLFFQVLIVTEGEGIVSSLKASHQLVWGNYWRTTAVILVPFFIMYALIMVVAIVAGFMGAMDAMDTAQPGMQVSFGLLDIVTIGVSVFFTPLLYSIFIVQVNDLKLRKSGSDLAEKMGS